MPKGPLNGTYGTWKLIERNLECPRGMPPPPTPAGAKLLPLLAQDFSKRTNSPLLVLWRGHLGSGGGGRVISRFGESFADATV